MDKQTDKCDRWMDGWMNGWIDGQIDGWMDEVDRQTDMEKLEPRRHSM